MVGDGSFQMIATDHNRRPGRPEGSSSSSTMVQLVGRVSSRWPRLRLPLPSRGPSGAYDGPRSADFVKLCQGMGECAGGDDPARALRAALADARGHGDGVHRRSDDWHERARLRKLLVGDGDADGSEMPAVTAFARGVRSQQKGHQRYL